MINWTTITNRVDYENQRYTFLLWTEESGNPKLRPYNDNPQLGAPPKPGRTSATRGFDEIKLPITREFNA